MGPSSSTPITKSYTPKRGRIKAQIFEGIVESVVAAATTTGNFLGWVKKEGDENDGSAPLTPPTTPSSSD
ncbi:hypothetical protein LXL04_017706 [Taraxacum kok-saghyz]